MHKTRFGRVYAGAGMRQGVFDAECNTAFRFWTLYMDRFQRLLAGKENQASCA